LLNEGRGQKRDLVHTDAKISYGWKRSKIFGKNSGKFGSIYFLLKGDDLFSVRSRGKQICAFMSLSAVLTA
jgi:hypothetical protein